MICRPLNSLQDQEQERRSESVTDAGTEIDGTGIGTYLGAKTHVEVMLDAVASSCDLVPDAFSVAFVERLDQMRAVCGSLDEVMEQTRSAERSSCQFERCSVYLRCSLLSPTRCWH